MIILPFLFFLKLLRSILSIYQRFLISISYGEVREYELLYQRSLHVIIWNRITISFSLCALSSTTLLLFIAPAICPHFPGLFQLSALSFTEILQSARDLVSRIRFLWEPSARRRGILS